MANALESILDDNLIQGERSTDPLLPVHVRFEKVVAESPHRTAVVVLKGQELTYAELNESANRIACELLKHTHGERQNVGVLIGRSAELIPAQLAVLKAGCVCVPLATEYPSAKLELMVENSQAVLVLTTSRDRRELGAPSLCVDEPEALAAHSPDNISIACRPEDIAYILYTSGTSGNAKGVLIHHAGIDNHLRWRRDFYRVTADDVFLHKAPIGFDVALWEILLPLTVGAKVVIAPPGSQGMVPKLLGIIDKQGVTIVQFVGSLFRHFLEFNLASQCRALRLVKCGGEAWSFDLVKRCKERLPQVQLANGYGPTEASLGVSAWKCDPDYEYGCLVLGKPVYNSAFLILDEHAQPVPLGSSGELYIGGEAVSPGYWHNPQLTAEKFVTLPCRQYAQSKFYRTGDIVKLLPDGNITFQGRRDNQVKINGVRIELEEIEEVIGNYTGVRQAAVVCREATPGDKVLHAFLVGDAPDIQALTTFCAKKLSPVVVPKNWAVVDKIPLTANGKIDREELLRSCA